MSSTTTVFLTEVWPYGLVGQYDITTCPVDESPMARVAGTGKIRTYWCFHCSVRAAGAAGVQLGPADVETMAEEWKVAGWHLIRCGRRRHE